MAKRGEHFKAEFKFKFYFCVLEEGDIIST